MSNVILKCAYPGCENEESIRYGGLCNEHGITPMDNRNVVIMYQAQQIKQLQQQIKEQPDGLLERAIRLIEQQVCDHESTQKAGFIWTECECCGMRWETEKGPRKTQFEEFLEKEGLL